MTERQVFQSLGQILFDCIPLNINWHKAWLDIIMQKGFIQISAKLEKSNGEQQSLRVGYPDKIQTELEWLHKESHLKWNSRWNKATFQLYPDNKFKIEYNFDEEYQKEIDDLNIQGGGQKIRFGYEDY